MGYCLYNVNMIKMKKLFTLFLTLLLLWSCSSQKGTQDVKEYDICVYGGTASGVIAATTAKKMGKTVVLIEPGSYLGGMTTGGLGATDIGNKYAITGLARKFYRDLGEYYGKFEQWRFAPSAAFKLMDRYVEENNIEVLFNKRVIQSSVENKAIQSITLEDSKNPNDVEQLTIKAKQFIDCTYEGDLMAKSGVSYFTGREANETFGETLNGVQMSVWHQFPDGVDPYKVEGDPTSGYCWGINDNELAPTGSGDKLIQAYNFRLCWTRDKENMVPFTKPDSYDPEKYELLARAIKKSGSSNIKDYLLIKKITEVDDKYDTNNCGPLSTDMIGMNYEYPDGDYATRERIWKEHEEYTKGLLYFLTHDERVPEELRKAVAEYGWAKDEYVENDNFPTQLYVREARRLNGEYVMTQKNCQGDEHVGDGIGLAAYGMDSHNCQRIVVNGMVKNEGDVQFHGFLPYNISYRSITPKREECTNLLVPVCVSSSHIAFGSIRMEPVFMVLGQSAGVAAAMAIDKKSSVQEVDVDALRKLLREDPYLDGSEPEVLVDEGEIDKVNRSGGWSKRYGGYKHSHMLTFNSGKNTYFTFQPRLNKTGEYEVFFFCTIVPDASKNMAIRINHKEGEDIVRIDPTASMNSFISLGTYSFDKDLNPSVTVDGSLTDGPIIADAVLFVPKRVN